MHVNMIPNRSPWIQQLRRTRPVVSLRENVDTDVIIVGGGIAGISTAFFALTNTDKKVVLLEADKVAHGATGHNAGQITSYFERPFSEIVEEFGLEKAIDGQRSVESAWDLLTDIIDKAGLQTPVYRFVGHAGLSTHEQVFEQLVNNRYRVEGGLEPHVIRISDVWEGRHEIPKKYADLYSVVPAEEIQVLLETQSSNFVACVSSPKGCTNSALFCEELIGYLLATYANRFSLHEGSFVSKVTLHPDRAVLSVGDHTVAGSRVVLCTNGFENFHIENVGGPPIDTKFHHTVAGRIGYMSGYIEPMSHAPTAASYHLPAKDGPVDDIGGEVYFYMTRRPYEHEGHRPHNLVCTGGPEKVLPNDAIYARADYCSEDVRESIDDFLRKHYNKYPEEQTEYAFCWHGLMGYTPNRIRRIGAEPCNPALMYNLGCNGVGILPSIYGGKRIAQILNGEKLPASIFDPGDARCEIE